MGDAFSTAGNFAHGDLDVDVDAGLSSCVVFSGRLFKTKPGFVIGTRRAPGRKIVFPEVAAGLDSICTGSEIRSSVVCTACKITSSSAVVVI